MINLKTIKYFKFHWTLYKFEKETFVSMLPSDNAMLDFAIISNWNTQSKINLNNAVLK